MQKEDTSIFYFSEAVKNLRLFVPNKDRSTKQHITVTQGIHGWGPKPWTVLSHHKQESGFLGRQEKEVSEGKANGLPFFFILSHLCCGTESEDHHFTFLTPKKKMFFTVLLCNHELTHNKMCPSFRKAELRNHCWYFTEENKVQFQDCSSYTITICMQLPKAPEILLDILLDILSDYSEQNIQAYAFCQGFCLFYWSYSA